MIIGLSEVFGILWVKITLQCRVGSIKKEKNRIKLAGFRTVGVSSLSEENLHLSLESGKSSSYTNHWSNKSMQCRKARKRSEFFLSESKLQSLIFLPNVKS